MSRRSGVLHVHHSGALDPVENMTLDEAMLSGGPSASLRIYSWRPRGISLGYFQALDDFADLRDRATLVRRSTGGGAIDHSDELTFALTVDAEVLPSDLGASYDLVHGAIREVLASVGVSTERYGRGPGANPRPRSRWCFESPSCHDLMTAEGKILGSAQRRTRGPRPRVLHHGSLVLRKPEFPARHCGAVASAAIDPTPEWTRALGDGIAKAIARALTLPIEEPKDLPLDLDGARRAVLARLDRR